MSQYMTIFAKEAKFGLRYWASISTKKEDADPKKKKKAEYVSANISVTLSDAAKKVFKKNFEPTSNDEVMMFKANVTDYWLKAVEGKEGDFVILFINELEPAEKEDD